MTVYKRKGLENKGKEVQRVRKGRGASGGGRREDAGGLKEGVRKSVSGKGLVK